MQVSPKRAVINVEVMVCGEFNYCDNRVTHKCIINL